MDETDETKSAEEVKLSPLDFAVCKRDLSVYLDHTSSRINGEIYIGNNIPGPYGVWVTDKRVVRKTSGLSVLEVYNDLAFAYKELVRNSDEVCGYHPIDFHGEPDFLTYWLVSRNNFIRIMSNKGGLKGRGVFQNGCFVDVDGMEVYGKRGFIRGLAFLNCESGLRWLNKEIEKRANSDQNLRELLQKAGMEISE